ncbi:MAG TPA: hypothetical protein VGF29_09855 [Hyphomicrobiaceae bacterium]|jgi:hypothetical protein
MKTDIHIRAFEAGDLPIIQCIRTAAFQPVFRAQREIVGETISALALTAADEEQAEYLAKVCDPNSGYSVYVALLGHTVVGFVSFSLNEKKRTGVPSQDWWESEVALSPA